MYIDDGIGACKSKAQCVKHKDSIVADLRRTEFVLNIPKSHLDPQQIGKWFGIYSL